MDEISVNKHLAPYFKMAEAVARDSSCVRAQFGAIIVPLNQDHPRFIVRYNQRVTNCCSGTCARSRFNLRHVERVEVGAEIHAETAALIDYRPDDDGPAVICLVGFVGERELLWTDAMPCMTCAINLKYAGFKYVYLHAADGQIKPISISEIISLREEEWEPVD